jgi:hypothetical protein
MRDVLTEIRARFVAALTAPPLCLFCRHPASTDWVMDPTGVVRGRCAGCIETSGYLTGETASEPTRKSAAAQTR